MGTIVLVVIAVVLRAAYERVRAERETRERDAQWASAMIAAMREHLAVSGAMVELGASARHLRGICGGPSQSSTTCKAETLMAGRAGYERRDGAMMFGGTWRVSVRHASMADGTIGHVVVFVQEFPKRMILVAVRDWDVADVAVGYGAVGRPVENVLSDLEHWEGDVLPQDRRGVTWRFFEDVECEVPEPPAKR